MLCQSADNFCVFTTWEELWVMVFQRQVTIAVCHLVMWRSRERRRQVGAAGKQALHTRAGRSCCLVLTVPGPLDLYNTAWTDTWGSHFPGNWKVTNSQVLCNFWKLLLPRLSQAPLCFPHWVIYLVYPQEGSNCKEEASREIQGRKPLSRSQGNKKWILVKLKKISVHWKYIQMGRVLGAGTEAK